MIEEGDLERVELPEGVEFFHLGYQRVFPDCRGDGDSQALYLLRRGEQEYVRDAHGAFYSMLGEYGFHPLSHGWAYFGIKITPDMEFMELSRTIEACLPTLIAVPNV